MPVKYLFIKSDKSYSLDIKIQSFSNASEKILIHAVDIDENKIIKRWVMMQIFSCLKLKKINRSISKFTSCLASIRSQWNINFNCLMTTTIKTLLDYTQVTSASWLCRWMQSLWLEIKRFKLNFNSLWNKKCRLKTYNRSASF